MRIGSARQLCLLALPVVLSGCTDPEFLSEPTTWSADIDATEKAAFAIEGALNDGLCQAIVAGRPEDVGEGLVARGFRARLPGDPSPTGSSRERVRTSTAKSDPATEPVDADAFRTYVAGITADFAIVERCKLKSHAMFLEDGDSSAYGRFDLRLGGRSTESGRIEIEGAVRARFARDGDSWQLTQLELSETNRDEYRGPGFVDVSALTGIGLHRSQEKQRALLDDLGNYNVTNIGGLTALDWNRDGAVDLLAYNIGSLFNVFLNNRVGGFDRVPPADLIPPAEAAMFYLFVDLDGDGMEELVGSEPLTCGSGADRIPIYDVARARMSDSGRGLELDYGCDDRFSHIAAEDFDGDGRLDLFFSNYGLAKQDVPLNHADAHDGGRNRMFLNRGDLRFEDVSDLVGLDGSTRRSLVGHWFDYNADGARDLLILNDFAENELYLKTASGRLEKTIYPPLTDSGFSMGISVADHDLDGDFDVYVSNMYSYAGRRILGVTSELDASQRSKLLAMASGNTLYENDGAGSYQEVAARHGLDNAQWAWGSVFVDYDNDGDRDVHVVNGMASNSDPEAKRAPDN